MTHRGFFGRALMALLLIAILIGIGSAIHRSGWTQGYIMGQLVAGAEVPMTPYGTFGYPTGPTSLGSFVRAVLLVMAIGLLTMPFLLVLGKLLLVGTWRAGGGPAGKPWEWAREWHRHHDHRPPWAWGERPEEKTEGLQPDATPNARGASS